MTEILRQKKSFRVLASVSAITIVCCPYLRAKPCLNESRSHTVDSNVALGQFRGQGLGQTQQSSLADIVWTQALQRTEMKKIISCDQFLTVFNLLACWLICLVNAGRHVDTRKTNCSSSHWLSKWRTKEDLSQ